MTRDCTPLVAVCSRSRLAAQLAAASLCQAGFQATAHFTPAAAASQHPGGVDVVVLDAADDPAFDLVPDLVASGTRVVVVSTADTAVSVAGALGAGASGFVTTDGSIADLVGAVSAATDALTYIDVTATGALIESQRPTSGEMVSPAVSTRERQVLSKVARGLTNAQIAGELNVSSHTVKTHLARIYKKLGVSDRASAVYCALRFGLLD